ncbi:putative NPH3 domain-containing protein [Helianthus annuus]|nr:putative NPH3 domain-containing protein [Helianthus annuus]
MQSHPCLSLEERSRLCRCLNYEKLSLEACKDLAKNPRIPPRIAVQALVSQHSNIPTVYTNDHHQDYSYIINDHNHQTPLTKSSRELMVLYNNNGAHDHLQYDSADHSSRTSSRYDQADKELDEGVVKLNLQKMQWRVVELEKVCREMKGQMSKMVKGDRVMLSGSSHGRPLPRLC